MEKRKNLFIKILIPLAIIVVIIGIYFFKNGFPSQGDSGAGRIPEVGQESAQEGQGMANGSSSDSAGASSEEGLVGLELSSIDIDALTSQGLPLMLDFGGQGCTYCEKMRPDLETIYVAAQGKALVHYTDVWEHPENADGFPISAVPSQVFFNADGTPYVPSENSGVSFSLYNSKDTGEHTLTIHTGMLTEKEMRTIFADMGVEL